MRIFGLALMVAAIWVAAEVYEHGVAGAFDGMFAGFAGDSIESPADRTRASRAPDRAADAFQRAYDKSEARVNDLLE